MQNRIIIIGAGMAGLSAGCYGQMNGFETQVFESHTLPGGVCTTWKRKGYKIDGCIHWLTGSAPGNSFYHLWQEVGVIQDRRMISHDEYARIEGSDGKTFIVYCDVDRLRRHMKELAPQDGSVIDEFCDGIRKSADLPMPVDKAPELLSIADRIRIGARMLHFLGFWRMWRGVTIGKFARRFKDPFLREVFPFAVNLQHPLDFPMLAFLTTLAWMDRGTAAYPLGGSLELARAVEKRYLALGGEIRYASKVEKILVEDGHATGVRLADGSEHKADYILSAADGHSTIFDMLGGKYVDSKIKRWYKSLPVYDPLIYIGIGVARSFAGVHASVTGFDYVLKEPVSIAGQKRTRLSLQIYNFDPTLAPAGKTVMRVWFKSDYEYWKQLAKVPESYKKEKELIAGRVMALLENRYPGIADDVETIDVATPMTFERYTDNWKGSFEGWRISNKTLMMRMRKTLPGLRNFYMAGQWVEPGGSLPTSLMSGRNAIQLICEQRRQNFQHGNPPNNASG